ncbi:MAG: hypothetical protein E7289_07435 [Lachnospiraceae bacterium]|nr:hypothetical protein [Lachnospiraceae bacterium]
MHIAVVADNIADRKQTERLLGRANTALAASIGTLFVDSYGDEASFLHACMRYDLFILDFDNDVAHSMEVARKLKEKSAPGLITVCKHADAPFQHETAIQGLYTLDKPILTAPLHKLLCDIHLELEKMQSRLDLVELRTDTDTHYVSRATILYARAFEKEHRLCYHFTDGSVLESTGGFDDLKRYLGDFDEFSVKPGNLLVNKDHIKEETKKSIRLSNGEALEYSLFGRFLKF